MLWMARGAKCILKYIEHIEIMVTTIPEWFQFSNLNMNLV